MTHDRLRVDLSRFDIGMARVVFSRAPDGAVDGVHFDLLPISARRLALGRATIGR